MAKANTVPTIYGHYATLAAIYKIPFRPNPITTLNHKLELGYTNPPETGYPDTKYLAIGNGGHAVVTGNNYISGLSHGCTDSALKNQLPVLIVPADNDIPLSEMSKYRGRTPMVISGHAYIVYWILALTLPQPNISFNTFTLSEGVVTNQAAFTPTLATQSPAMIDPSNVDLNLVSGNHISVTIDMQIHLTEANIQNIINACMLLYGTADAAIISEMALVSGFDVEAPITVNGVDTTYTEIQCAQVSTFVNLVYPAAANSTPSLTEGLSVGMAQPLLGSI